MIDLNAVDDKRSCRGIVTRILISPYFDGAISIVILCNSISIGAEITYQLENKDTRMFERLEHLYLAVYTAELALRWYVSGRHCLKSWWVRFDLFMVAGGVASLWIIMPLLGKLPPGFGPMMVFRMMRLARLVRAVRLLVAFRTLWMLVRGLLSAGPVIGYTFLLSSLLIYVWACLGVEIITTHALVKTDDEFAAHVDEYFADIPITALTLCNFLWIDGSADVYLPLVHKDKRLLLYFMVFLFMVSVALMNLVTAVIAEKTIEQAEADRELKKAEENEKRKALIAEIKVMFLDLDSDGSGVLTREEIENAPYEVQDKMCDLFQKDGYQDIVDIMHTMCDLDDPEGTTVEEFLGAASKLLFSKNPIELLQLQKTISVMNKEVKETAKSIENEEPESPDSKREYRKSVSSVSTTSFRRLSQVLLNQETDMDQEMSEAQAIIKETVEALARATDKAGNIETFTETYPQTANATSVQMNAMESKLRKLEVQVKAIERLAESSTSNGLLRPPSPKESLKSLQYGSQTAWLGNDDDECEDFSFEIRARSRCTDLDKMGKMELLTVRKSLERRIKEQQKMLSAKDEQLMNLYAQNAQTLLMVQSAASTVPSEGSMSETPTLVGW